MLCLCSLYPPMVYFLLWLAFVVCISFCFASCLNEEGAALIAFKNSLDEEPNWSLGNWNSSDGNPCSWSGVSCDNRRVVSLSLPRNKLTGFLNPSVGYLVCLRHINLRNNKLFGSLPVELFSLPGIQSLVLYGNSFSGSIPSQIGNLKFLQILDLSQNSFNGSLPTSLLRCQRLKILDVRDNNFTGPLPQGFGANLSLLEKLDVSNNSLNGNIPSDIGNLSHLQQTLDFSHNQFSGQIPQSLGKLPEKVYIDLSYNKLTGKIPEHGALVNRGPTAFIGNPELCGSPLKNQCSGDNLPATTSTVPSSPENSPSAGLSYRRSGERDDRRGLSKTALMGIVAGDILAIVLIALVFFYYYWRLVSRAGKGCEKRERKEYLCFRTEESDSVSDSIHHFDLVALDSEVNFDLDELLKASAFVLGKSGIGILYKVVLDDGLTLAVRRLGGGGLQRFREFRTEVEAIGKMKHPNIVSLRAYYWSVEEKLLIYEFIPNGNLTTALLGKPVSSPLPWVVRFNIIKGIAKGLAFLHEFSPKKYIHGDLKPGNILLRLDMEPCISDFGLSRLANIAGGSAVIESSRMPVEKQRRQLPEISGNLSLDPELCYQAPEALHILKPSQKWDVYSFGVILLEIISGRSPLDLLSTSNLNIVRWIQMCIEEKKPLSEVVDPSLTEDLASEEQIVSVLKIALACVQSSPEKRPSMRHIAYTLMRVPATL